MKPGQWFTKAQMKALRQLAGTVHQRELSKALVELEAEFGRWRAGEITAFDLSDLIHKFHDGINRELWKRHTYLKPPDLVAHAVATGVLREHELDPAVLPLLKSRIELHRLDWSSEDTSGEEDGEDTAE